MTWRTVQFTYRMPDGTDTDELETNMIEACAAIIGCECDDTSERCAVDWVGSAGPIDDPMAAAGMIKIINQHPR